MIRLKMKSCGAVVEIEHLRVLSVEADGSDEFRGAIRGQMESLVDILRPPVDHDRDIVLWERLKESKWGSDFVLLAHEPPQVPAGVIN
jgi:hypothetical protein